MRICVLVVVVAAACSDRYGAYLTFHVPAGSTKLELYFGGHFPDRSCNGQLATEDPPPLESTAGWSRGPADDPVGDNIWRRQFHSTDVIDLQASQKAYDYYLATDDDSTTAGYPDTLGDMLIAVATDSAGNVVGISKPLQFSVPGNAIYKYDVELVKPSGDIEQWGAGTTEPSCLRWTVQDSTGGSSSTFVVREWDHDCDGLLTKNCDFGADAASSGAPTRGRPPTTGPDDCLPESYCGINPITNMPEGCRAHEACRDPSMPSSNNELVRAFGTCANDPTSGGARSCIPDTNPVLCYTNDASNDDLEQHCDRLLYDCALVDSTPDLFCKVPVSDGSNGRTKGTLCSNSVTVPTYSSTIFGCGAVVTGLFGTVAVSPYEVVGVTVSTFIAAGGEICSLTLAPTAVKPLYGNAGYLPATRVLLDVQDIANSQYGTMIVHLEPDEVDCSQPQTLVPCELSTQPPLGQPHTCR